MKLKLAVIVIVGMPLLACNSAHWAPHAAQSAQSDRGRSAYRATLDAYPSSAACVPDRSATGRSGYSTKVTRPAGARTSFPTAKTRSLQRRPSASSQSRRSTFRARSLSGMRSIRR